MEQGPSSLKGGFRTAESVFSPLGKSPKRRYLFPMAASDLPRRNSVRARVSALAVWALALAGLATGAGAEPSLQPGVREPRSDQLPRKVLIATMLCDRHVLALPLGERFQKMDELAAQAADEAKAGYPGKRLDLVVFPEYFLAKPGDSMEQQSLHLEEVQSRVGACARRYGLCVRPFPKSMGAIISPALMCM